MFLPFLNFPGLFRAPYFDVCQKTGFVMLQTNSDKLPQKLWPRALGILRREIQKGLKHWRPDLFYNHIIYKLPSGG